LLVYLPLILWTLRSQISPLKPTQHPHDALISYHFGLGLSPHYFPLSPHYFPLAFSNPPPHCYNSPPNPFDIPPYLCCKAHLPTTPHSHFTRKSAHIPSKISRFHPYFSNPLSTQLTPLPRPLYSFFPKSSTAFPPLSPDIPTEVFSSAELLILRILLHLLLSRNLSCRGLLFKAILLVWSWLLYPYLP
jgi:hypothetical protein